MRWSLPQFVVILAVALTVWLWPSIFGGKVLMPLDLLGLTPPFSEGAQGGAHNELIGDMLYENLAWKTLQRDCVLNGEWPLWNPDSFCGHPLYATGQTSTFYPPNLILVLVPLPYGYVIYSWLHLLAGGVFMYLFLRRIGVGGFGASIGGVMFAMSTSFALRLIWPMLLGTAIWLPLMLWWLDFTADTWTPRRALAGVFGGAVLFALPLVAGFFEIAFYMLVACGLYALVLGLRVARRERDLGAGLGYWAKAGGVTLLAAGLSAPQLLPFLEVMKLNVRTGEVTYARARELAMTWPEAITFAVPDALGNPSRHQQFDLAGRQWVPIKSSIGADFHYFGPKNYVESTHYLGILPLAFVAMSVIAPGRRRLYFWGLLVLSLALAFVTPVYGWLFNLVPGFDQVRSPWRWTLLTMLACTYLAAIGADAWYHRMTAAPGRFLRVAATLKVIALAVLVAALAVLLFRPEPVIRLAGRIMSADARAAGTFATPADLAGLLWINAARFAIFALAATILVALAYWRRWGSAGVAVASFLGVALTALDLGQATHDFNTHADPALLQQRPPIVQHLQEAQAESPEPVRIGRFGWQDKFRPNLPMLFGLQDVGGYDSIILTSFARYLQAIEPQKLLIYNLVENIEKPAALDSPLCALLNIRYLLSVGPVKHPDYEKVDVPGNLGLYRLKPDKQVPRAFLVGRVDRVLDLDEAIAVMKTGRIDVRTQAVVQTVPGGEAGLVDPFPGPAGSARMVNYRPSRVRIETTAAGRQFLVLCDVYYPGWEAYIDGARHRIMVTDGIFRGVSVPAGKHTVEFRFEPSRLGIGTALSLSSLAVLMVAAVVHRLGRRDHWPEPHLPSA
ncbi:MAG: YfhO family protein [Planctomycetes bacterium]|nr:YfhO family protein [Planctomycetota bacterium]